MEEYRYHLFATYEGEGSKNMAQILFKHFSLKGKSGGGDCQVSTISSDLFCISFKSEQVRDRALSQSQKVTIENSEVTVTLHLSPEQKKTLPEQKVDSDQDEISMAACKWIRSGEQTQAQTSEPSTKPAVLFGLLKKDMFCSKQQHSDQEETSFAACEQIQIPSTSVYSELLQPYYLRSIRDDFTDVKLQFDSSTLMLQITGTPQSVSSVKSDVHDALRRIKSKEVNIHPALTTYLNSKGSGNVSRILFRPEEIAAAIDIRSDSCVVINGFNQYDIKRAERILIEGFATKEVQIHEEEAASVVNSNSFGDFIEELNKTHTGVQAHVVDSSVKKPVIVVTGRKTDLISGEEKIHRFIYEKTKKTAKLGLDGRMELAECLPLLLDKLELSHLSGRVRWNAGLETLELTGTQKENDQNVASIKEKIKGLHCKTVTICRPGAHSYFKADGQEFLNLLGSMLSCMAVLETEPGEVNLQTIPERPERNTASTGGGIVLHGDDKDMCLISQNIRFQATVSDKLSELADAIINPLCRSVTGSKILHAAGQMVSTELKRTVQRNAITLTGPGNLPCRLLVHVPCLCGAKAKGYLQDAIQECHKRKFKSITVFLDMTELHQNFDKNELAKEIIQTALSEMKAEEMMRVVLPQESLFQCFTKAAESLYNENYTRRNEEFFLSHLTPHGLADCIHTSSEPLDDPKSLHRHSVLCEPAVIHIFSKHLLLLHKAKAATEKHYAGFLSTDTLVEPYLRTCGDEALAKISQLQEKHGVNVIIGDGTVTFNGLAVKTSIAREEAFILLKEAVALNKLKHKKEVLQNIQWVIDGNLNLSCEDNYDVEVQYLCLHEPIEVTPNSKTFTVNVSDMTAMNKETTQGHTVSRTELTVERFSAKRSTTKEEDFIKVEIDIDSLEYISVERRFNESLSRKIINKIERIENRNLWKHFSLNPIEKEKFLFYGVKHADVEQVKKHGFFRPPEAFFSAETAQGRGIYFYVDASRAQRRCEADAQGLKIMFLGRVKTGTFAEGKKGMCVPPPVNPSDPGVLHHSVVDSMDNPSIFVVFTSDRAYPEYCITFSDCS
ncbi:hypothetical protein NFI96_016732 [Prochilodus magdalenae]|nr:hypothetical protein NFI96_016732 [Prochilodus magdalenae]